MFNTKKFSRHTLLLALSSAGDWVSEKKVCQVCTVGVAGLCRLIVNCSVHYHTYTAALPPHHNSTLQPPSAGIHAEPYTDNLGDFLGRLSFAMFF
jgi:hypothetical protein